jgi:hypothetical protein
MGLKRLFKTDAEVERKGIEIQYGTTIWTIARSGGANVGYRKKLAKELKPLQRAIVAELVTDDELLPKLIKTFAEESVLGCKVENADGSTTPGIDMDEGELWPFTTENVIKCLTQLPDLYRDLQEKSSNARFFLESLEDAAKN